MDNIGKRVQQLRKEKGMSLREFGKEVNLSHSYIDAIEKGTTTPAIPSLEAIAKRFDLDVSYFLADEGKGVILYSDPAVLSRLPKDLQEFVMKEENTPYLKVAKQLAAYDLEKLTENEMAFLVDWLKGAIKK